MEKALSIVIAGGGLAGLLAAIRLARDGHSVQVMERRETLSDRGGGLMIRPNGTRHLDAWNLTKNFETVARASKKSAMHSLLTGEVTDEQVMQSYSRYPNWVLTRQRAQKILFTEAQDTPGVRIHFGVVVIDVHESLCAAVLKDGSIVKADIIIVADGTNLPLDIVRDHAEIGKLLSAEGAVDVWSDQGRHVVSGAGTEVYMEDFIINGSGKGTHEEEKNHSLWDEVGDINHVRQVYHNVAPPLRAWLSVVERCSRWTLCYLPSLPSWRSESGTVILLGDAAHAMLPSAARGLSQIIEDVATLSYLLNPAKDHH